MKIINNLGKVAKVAIILGIGVFTCAIFNVTQTASAYKLEVGQPSPNLVLPSLEDGNPLSLAKFRGQKVILHIWASW